MCEARVVLRSGEDQKDLMDDVVSVVPGDDGLTVTNILGDSIVVRARVAEVQMLHPHTVILEAE